MHLQQRQQIAEIIYTIDQNIINKSSSSHPTIRKIESSYIQHYTSIQEITDVVINHSPSFQTPNKAQKPQFIDYIDQFLWKSQHHEHSSFFEENLNKISTLMQKQDSIALKQELQSPQKQLNNCYQKQVKTKAKTNKQPKVGLSKDYRKNLAGYIIKKVLRILISSAYTRKLQFACNKHEVDIQLFKNYCYSSLPNLFGPNSIYELLLIKSQSERKMKQLLLHLITKILRKQYALSILTQGRMRDYEAYIQIKNSGLLYFSGIVP